MSMTDHSQERIERVRQFRLRLLEAMERVGISRSALARQAGIDRSTLSQLLGTHGDRLPRAETVAAIASVLQVSLDWLLGLTETDRLGTDIVQQSLQIEPGDPDSAHERLLRWYEETAGYKIRYRPTTLPDLLKTYEVIEFEYRDSASHSLEQVQSQQRQRLAYNRMPETEMEACSPFEELDAFALGHGVWRQLDLEIRLAQLDRMRKLCEELYPTFRWFLYSGRSRYFVPVTIFGRQRAALYVGDMYFVFNTADHILALIRQFDDLIRAAVVQPPDMPAYLEDLRDRAERAA